MPIDFANGFRMRRAIDPFGGMNRGIGSLNFLRLQQSETPNMGEEDTGFQTPEYKPGPNTQALMRHIRNMPNRENYAPSKWRRFGSILTGALTGIANRNPSDAFKTSQQLNDMPYDSAAEDWKSKGQGLGELADIEEKGMSRQEAMAQKFREYLLDERRTRNTEALGRNTLEDSAIRRPLIREQTRETGLRADKMPWDIANSIANLADTQEQTRIRPLQLGVSQRNAATAEGQLGVARDANARGWNALDNSKYQSKKNRESLERRDNPSYEPAIDLQRLEAMATKDVVLANPQLEEYYDFDNNRMLWDQVPAAMRSQVKSMIDKGVAIKKAQTVRR